MSGNHKSKKRKREAIQDRAAEIDTSKPTAIFKPTKGRHHTLSIALPGSIIANAQSHDLKTALAGHIARALAVFCVDEVVIFDDHTIKAPKTRFQNKPSEGSASSAYTGSSDPNRFLAHLLSYLECPPYLRKHLFPMHPNLRTASTLPSLDLPHSRPNESCTYHEGVTLSSPADISKSKSKSDPSTSGTLVDVGLPSPIPLSLFIRPSTRVTLMVDPSSPAKPVRSSAPRENEGYYWGYAVRTASSLSTVLTECPFELGYDITIGTSERGIPLEEMMRSYRGEGKRSKKDTDAEPQDMKYDVLRSFNHLLIVFGGVAGLEAAVEADEELQGMSVRKPEELFDYWVDLCPGQGSRTMRTEEAVWVGLMGFRDIVVERGAKDG